MRNLFFISLLINFLFAVDGKKVFETYCWGCHHQTSEAFGPSKRTAEEIRGMITDPGRVSKIFGYKRNAMPGFRLSEEELKAITEYILSFRTKEDSRKKE
jgi:mono/diheme cytochrome c family protein